MKKLVVIFLAFFILGFASVCLGQTPYTYTLSFDHDGLNTDSYAVTVDGVRATITPTCAVVGTTRTCSSPLTLTMNTVHSVTVIAVGTFGEASSIPFVCDVPKNPANPKVRK